MKAEAPRIDWTEADPNTGVVWRLRANSAHTQAEGWRPKEITVEVTGPSGMNLDGRFQGATEALHAEISQACANMNQREGRS